jgi:hypothetical protein
LAEGTGGSTDGGAEGEHGGGVGKIRKRRFNLKSLNSPSRNRRYRVGANVDVLAPKVLAVIAKVGRRFCIADRPSRVIGGSQLHTSAGIVGHERWQLEIIERLCKWGKHKFDICTSALNVKSEKKKVTYDTEGLSHTKRQTKWTSNPLKPIRIYAHACSRYLHCTI